jgi:hypothetical protein
MNTIKIRTICILVFIVFASSMLSAQEEFPEPGEMKPDMSEFWLPQPVIVTPGDIENDQAVPAPSDAVVLFDGKDLSAWKSSSEGEAKWIVADGVFTVKKGTGDIETKKHFQDFQLHLEWKVPVSITGEGQARGNSGVYIHGFYEVQVLDNYENKTYANGQAGSIYKQTPPLVNAMKEPGKWNVYDIIFKAPTFKMDGTYRSCPFVTVIHNGVIVQNNTRINGSTEYIGFPLVKKLGEGPILLQDHGDPSEAISFRNIWIREL